MIGSQCLPKDFKLPLVVHAVKAYVDCYEMTEILNVLLEKVLCSNVDIINGFGLLGLLAGGALLACCGQVQLVLRGNPARCFC